MAEEKPAVVAEPAKDADASQKKAKPKNEEGSTRVDKRALRKVRKKEWYVIKAPQSFEHAVIGETPAYESGSLVGRIVTVNLMTLTNDVKRQNMNVQFEIDAVAGTAATTKIRSVELVSGSIKRMVRRACEKMDISFACKTADGQTIRVKPLLITKSAVNNSTLAKIHKLSIGYLRRMLKTVSFENAIDDMVAKRTQASLKKYLNKIYPLKTCEIRYAGLEREVRQQEKTV